jgi:hypothetical protein
VQIRFLALVAFALAGFPGPLSAWEPGVVPKSPARMTTSGFSVNNQDRDDVVAFWQAVYQASEGYESRVGWTGNYTGNSGKTSAAFVDDVKRRLNYFRAMSGVPSNAKVNSGANVVITPADPFKPSPFTEKSSAAQDAALMMVRNFNANTGVDLALTHNPQPGLTGWSQASWNAMANGNFAFGVYGPGALTEYMVEALSSNIATSSWNNLVGHRRWCLYPRATDFATGDQPGSTAAKPPSSVFYVLQNESEYDAGTSSGFVAFPSPGFFPAGLNSSYWSLSREGADFSSAKVKMTDSKGNPVPILKIDRSDNYGDPAIIWNVGGAVSMTEVYNDMKYNITVSGIAGDLIPSSYSYSVTLINPDRITSPQKLIGPSTVKTTQEASFSLTAPARAEAVQVVAFKRQSSSWQENGENKKKMKLIDGTANSSPLVVKTSAFGGFGTMSGKYGFHLTFPTSYDAVLRGVPEQIFELDREIIPKSGAKLEFIYRRGYMTKGTTLETEYTSNGGVTWKSLGSPITGVSDTQADDSISSASIKLPKSSKSIRVRFRLFTKGGAIYTHEASPNFPTGIFMDEIGTKRCQWLERKKVNFLSATTKSFKFSSKLAGAKLSKGQTWVLALSTKLGGKWFPLASPRSVTIVAP